MPREECDRMDERLRFVARLLDGEKMAVACRDFGISRMTGAPAAGYKIFARYKEFGIRGLEDRSQSSCRHPNQLPFQIEKAMCGRICIGRRKINLSKVFAGQYVGVREVADEVWLAGRPDPGFLDYDLGFFDRELDTVEPVGKNPFAPKVLPMLSAGRAGNNLLPLRPEQTIS